MNPDHIPNPKYYLTNGFFIGPVFAVDSWDNFNTALETFEVLDWLDERHCPEEHRLQEGRHLQKMCEAWLASQRERFGVSFYRSICGEATIHPDGTSDITYYAYA